MTWDVEGTSDSTGAAAAGLLRIAAAAYLARYKGTSRMHTASDLRIYLGWCADRDLHPLEARRVDVELYLRWSQEIRRFRPSTVWRRLSVVSGFYHTCVIDGLLEHSPADHVRRPHVMPESPTLGLSHLQFEALLTAVRESPNIYDFALVSMLGLLDLRVFEATGTGHPRCGDRRRLPDRHHLTVLASLRLRRFHTAR
jgi:integrase/recombinase XerD